MERLFEQHPANEFIALTGLTHDTFRVVFERYCGPATEIKKPVYLFWLFQYYKQYPVERALRSIHGGKLKSRKNFMTRIHTWEVRKQTIICDDSDK
jgi:hypothetical protein